MSEQPQAIERHETPLRTMRGTSGRFARGAPVERPEPEEIPPDWKPVRVWTAGPGTPQDKIADGLGIRIAPGHDYAYVCRTPRELELVKKSLGPGRFWPDNIPEDDESLQCAECRWSTRNFYAYQWHTNNAHGRDQPL